MTSLNLPEFHPRIREHDGRRLIYDQFRKKYIVLTPEEWVRQNFLNYLLNHLGYPRSLMKVEFGVRSYPKLSRRADIMIYDRLANPFMLVECKAARVPLDQRVFEQLSRYNQGLKARHLVITNGLQHYCCLMDYSSKKYTFLENLPAYA